GGMTRSRPTRRNSNSQNRLSILEVKPMRSLRWVRFPPNVAIGIKQSRSTAKFCRLCEALGTRERRQHASGISALGMSRLAIATRQLVLPNSRSASSQKLETKEQNRF